MMSSLRTSASTDIHSTETGAADTRYKRQENFRLTFWPTYARNYGNTE